MPPPRAPGAPGRSAREDAAGRRGLRLRVTDPLLPLTRLALRVLRPWPLPGTQTLPLPLPHCAWVPRSPWPPLPTSSSREGESRRFQGAPRGPQVPPDVPAPRRDPFTAEGARRPPPLALASSAPAAGDATVPCGSQRCRAGAAAAPTVPAAAAAAAVGGGGGAAAAAAGVGGGGF